MLCFYKISNMYGKEKGNYLNSIIINFVYLLLIVPGLYLMQNPTMSKYWFFRAIVNLLNNSILDFIV